MGDFLGLKIKGFELAEQYFCTNFEIWKHEKKEQKKTHAKRTI